MIFVVQPHAIACEIWHVHAPYVSASHTFRKRRLSQWQCGGGVPHTYDTYLDQRSGDRLRLNILDGPGQAPLGFSQDCEVSSTSLCARSLVAAYSVLPPVGLRWLRLGEVAQRCGLTSDSMRCGVMWARK